MLTNQKRRAIIGDTIKRMTWLKKVKTKTRKEKNEIVKNGIK